MRAVRAVQAGVQQCSESRYPATRDPSNPLLLPTAPGPDPLHGAHFFVDGPRHGLAAGAIEQLLGIDPMSYSDAISWKSFEQSLQMPPLSTRLSGNMMLARKIRLYEKIADQEEPQNISLYAGGGGPGAIFAQTQKILCGNLMADPGAVPVLSTFFIYPNGLYWPPARAIRSWRNTFWRLTDEMAEGIDRRPAVIMVEIDAIGSAGCLTKPALALWESDVAYEMHRFAMLPHTVVYLEAGYSDAEPPQWTADVLTKSDVMAGRGFFTNDTHFAWSSNEDKWATRVSKDIWKMTHHTYRAHFVINTAQNGRGPLLNPHPVTQGIEDLCNPPGRGVGRRPTGDTAPTHDGDTLPLLDGLLWTGVPGRSHNSDCHPGDAPAGVFDPRFALELAAHANEQLGPGYPSQPY